MKNTHICFPKIFASLCKMGPNFGPLQTLGTIVLSHVKGVTVRGPQIDPRDCREAPVSRTAVRLIAVVFPVSLHYTQMVDFRFFQIVRGYDVHSYRQKQMPRLRKKNKGKKYVNTLFTYD